MTPLSGFLTYSPWACFVVYRHHHRRRYSHLSFCCCLQSDFDEIDMSGEAGCFFRDQKRRIGESHLLKSSTLRLS